MSTAENLFANDTQPPIETARLVLRRPELADAPRLADLLNNFNVAGNLARVRLPFTEADTAAWLPLKVATNDPHEMAWLITTEADGVIGTVGFHRDGGETVLGYWLGEPYWGHGYMTEAVRAALHRFFGTTSAQSIRSGVFHFNMASLAVQYKFGFVESGRSEVFCLARGVNVEHIDTELTREDFESLDFQG